MPAVYIIMPRCLLPIRKRVHGSGSGSYCLSFRAVLNHHAARVYIIIQRCYSQSFRAVLNHHSAGLIAYQVAGLLSIIPRCYSAGGSALSCRGVLLYHAAGCCYSQSCRRSTSSCRGSYCLSFRAALNHPAARVYIIMPAV